MKSGPRLYSYTRFSSPEQGAGDSERRQTEAIEAARKHATARGLVMDEGLRMIDRGMSGFKGTHREKGAFGAFLQKVETGEVPRGSILLVENIDRLGREPYLTAMQTIISLLKGGITIETLSPPDSYTTESVNNNGFWRLVAHIDRAHAESKRKSDLAQANWRQKRKLASEKILTARAPAWLRSDRDGFKSISEAVATIQQIFQLKLEGFGKSAIEKKLNVEAAWIPPGRKGKPSGWRASYIEKILGSRAVIGEFQLHRLENGKRVPEGDPILGYFPVIVRPALFHAVQTNMKGNRGTGGRTGKAKNIFQNVVKCAYCGGSMVFIDKGETAKGGKYLACDNGRRGVRDAQGKPKCKAYKVRYAEFETTLLDNLSKLRPELVLPNPDEQAKEAKNLQAAIAGLIGELADIESQIDNFLDQIGITSNPAIRARYERRMETLEAKKPEREAEKVKKEVALRELERGAQDFARWQKSITGLKKAIAEDVATRIRLKTHLKEFISKIEIFAEGDEHSVEHALALIEESLPELEKSESYPAFKRYLRERLLSPEGRFFRLFLKTAGDDSRSVRLAPSESLALRTEIKGKELRFTAPPLGRLCREFFDGRKHGFVAKASRLYASRRSRRT